MHRAPRRTSLRRGLIKIQYKGKKGIDALLSLTFIDIQFLERESWQNKLETETNLVGEILVGRACIFLSLFFHFFAE